MRAQKESVGFNRGLVGTEVSGLVQNPVRDDRPTLEEAGIDKNLAHRARKAAALSADEFEGKVSDWREQSASENKVTLDINKNLAHRARKAAALPTEEFEGKVTLDDAQLIVQSARFPQVFHGNSDYISKYMLTPAYFAV